MPDTEEPKPPPEQPAETVRATQPTEISDEEYHDRSEEFMNTLNEKAELLQEGREDVEVEYSVGHPHTEQELQRTAKFSTDTAL